MLVKEEHSSDDSRKGGSQHKRSTDRLGKLISNH